jgi:hypothetical protein
MGGNRPQAPVENKGNVSRPSHLDLIKGGGYQLKKLDLNAPPRPSVLPAAPVSHLDLIKGRNFNLRKVDRSQPLPPAPRPNAEADPSQLTLQDILQKAASIRKAVHESETQHEGNTEKSESTVW